MSNSKTIRMLRAYFQQKMATRFLQSQFVSPAENKFNSEYVEIDIERSGEEIAIVVQNLCAGYRDNSTDIYTNKQFLPAIYKERVPINACDGVKRQPGQTPFQDPSYRAFLVSQLLKAMDKVIDKIMRSLELQAAQVLQTGQVNLINESGTVVYTIDYKPKTAHFPTVATGWGQIGADPIGDLDTLGNVIRTDGLLDPDLCIFGDGAWRNFQQDDAVKDILDNRRIDVGTIKPEMRDSGATYHGTFHITNYNYELWTYSGRYNDPNTGNSTRYIADDKVIMRASIGRLDAVFGSVPNVDRDLGLQTILPEMPRRISEGQADLFTHVYKSNDGDQLFGTVATRALMIPTAIDTYGCLDTQP